jgi:hypothetical protein
VIVKGDGTYIYHSTLNAWWKCMLCGYVSTWYSSLVPLILQSLSVHLPEKLRNSTWIWSMDHRTGWRNNVNMSFSIIFSVRNEVLASYLKTVSVNWSLFTRKFCFCCERLGIYGLWSSFFRTNTRKMMQVEGVLRSRNSFCYSLNLTWFYCVVYNEC